VRRSAALVFLFLLALSACAGDPEPEKTTGSATPVALPSGVPEGAVEAEVVADGEVDTVWARIGGKGDGLEITIARLVPPARGACWDAEAKAFANQELPVGSTIYLLPGGPDDQRYVYQADGAFYNEKALRLGFAKLAQPLPDDRFAVEFAASEKAAQDAGAGVWACADAPAVSPAPPAPPAPRPPGAPAPAPRPPAPAPAPAPAPPNPPGIPVGRTVALGDVFLMRVGEAVGIQGQNLTVSYTQVMEDSRCPPGVQCIQAGNGKILVTMHKEGSNSAAFELNTTDGPKSGRYLNYTVTLVEMNWETTPTVRFRVS
jgi:hypothetical protein